MRLKTYCVLIVLLIAFSCKKDDPTQPVVPTFPQVHIVSPINNSSIGGGLVPVLVEATDDNGVAKVEVYVDSQLDTTLAVPPYRYLWDTGIYPDSSRHAMFAKAYDTDNNVTGSTVVVTTVYTLRPSNLQVTTATDTSVTLQWSDNSRVETGYEIEQSGNNGPFTRVKQVAANTITAFVADTFDVGTTYRFRLRAVKDSTVSGYSNEPSFTLQFLAPSNLNVTSLSGGEVRLSWVDNSAFETRFLVDRAVNGGQYVTIAALPADAVTFNNTSLDTNNTLSYRIKAESRHNSSYSNTISIRYFPYYDIRTLIGGTYSVNSVAFSPDGNTIASGSYDQNIKLWRVSDGTLLRTLAGHTSSVNSVTFSPNGNTVASGSFDNSIKIWQVSDGTLIRTLTGHTSSVRSVTFSPDGAMLASGSYDHSIKLWRVSDGTLLRTLIGDANGVYSVAFSPDGNTVASGGDDSSIKFWRVSDGALLRTLTGHTALVNSVAFSPDGNTIASGSADNRIKLWRVGDGALLRTLPGGAAYTVNSVAFGPVGNIFASGSVDTRLWWLSDGTLLRTQPGGTYGVSSVAFSPDGYTFASGGVQNGIKLWQSAGSIWQVVP